MPLAEPAKGGSCQTTSSPAIVSTCTGESTGVSLLPLTSCATSAAAKEEPLKKADALKRSAALPMAIATLVARLGGVFPRFAQPAILSAPFVLFGRFLRPAWAVGLEDDEAVTTTGMVIAAVYGPALIAAHENPFQNGNNNATGWIQSK